MLKPKNNIPGYWTGGRDVLSPNQFIWTHSESEINPSLEWYHLGGPRTCVLLLIAPFFDQNGKILPIECTGFGRALARRCNVNHKILLKST